MHRLQRTDQPEFCQHLLMRPKDSSFLTLPRDSFGMGFFGNSQKGWEFFIFSQTKKSPGIRNPGDQGRGFRISKNPQSGLRIFENLEIFISGIFENGDFPAMGFFPCDGISHQKATSGHNLYLMLSRRSSRISNFLNVIVTRKLDN